MNRLGACVIENHVGGNVLRKNSAAHQAHHEHRLGDPRDGAEREDLPGRNPRDPGRRPGAKRQGCGIGVHQSLTTRGGEVQPLQRAVGVLDGCGVVPLPGLPQRVALEEAEVRAVEGEEVAGHGVPPPEEIEVEAGALDEVEGAVSVGRWAADRIELGVRGAHQGPARDVDDRGELQVSGV